MALKDLFWSYLEREGYRPQLDESDGEVTFKREGLTYSFYPDENDETFFALRLPAIYDVTEENKAAVLEAIDKVNKDLKVVKLYTLADKTVFVAFEIFMDQSPEIDSIANRAIPLLAHARIAFYRELGD